MPSYGQFSGMNTMSILLGATFALLLAAVVLSLQNMKHGVTSSSPDELEMLKAKVELLALEQDIWRRERDNQKSTSGVISTESEIERMRAELAAKEAEIENMTRLKNEAEKKADTFSSEAALIGQRDIERADKELRRARQITDALMIGKITEYIQNPELGNFVTIEMIMPELVRPGNILAIRRKTGILGKLEITEISSEGAIGIPMPGFGPVEPEPGDELIIEPQI